MRVVFCARDSVCVVIIMSGMLVSNCPCACLSVVKLELSKDKHGAQHARRARQEPTQQEEDRQDGDRQRGAQMSKTPIAIENA